MLLGLVASIVLASGSLLHALGMIMLGLLLGIVGTDVNTGAFRYTFGLPQLADGVNFVIVAMGIYGLGEIISNLEHESTRSAMIKTVTGLFPTREDFRRIWKPVLRGTALGSALGILPGGGAMLASFASYSMEKRFSSNPGEFGKGAIEGVAGPESANNAGAQTSFIPMLTLGIPSNPVMALMIGALMIQGIQPGPAVMTEQPALFWGLIVSMWIGNAFLLVLNLPLIGLWVKMISVPYHLLFPPILVFCAIGVFSINNSGFDVLLMAFFGAFGYRPAQARLRAGADAARLHSRADDGGEPPSCPDDLQGRPDRLRDPPRLGNPSGAERTAAHHGDGAGGSEEAGRSLYGRDLMACPSIEPVPGSA